MPSPKVRWIGPVGDRGGYPQASRTYIQAMHRVGVDLSVGRLVFDEPNTSGHADQDDLIRKLTDRPIDYDVLIIHCVPDLWPAEVAKELKAERLRREDPAWQPKAIIGVTIWETDRVHARWGRAIDEAGTTELWLPNEFNVSAFGNATKTPTYIVPHAHDLDFFDADKVEPLDLSAWGVTPDMFVIGAGFTWNVRKNPEGLLQAYCAEFTPDDNVCLILKTYAGQTTEESKERIERFVSEATRRTGIRKTPAMIILPQMLPYDALLSLYRRIDVGAYPYRGEGWGLHVSEMMLMGTPSIVTGWSGPAEFVEDGVTGWHIPYQMMPVYGMPRFYDVRQNWAEPDLVRLRQLMRRRYEDGQEEAAKVGERAREAIVRRYGFAEVGQRMRTRLGELLQ